MSQISVLASIEQTSVKKKIFGQESDFKWLVGLNIYETQNCPNIKLKASSDIA